MPECRKCRHYHVTWDKEAPHGCRAMGFKSRRMPWWVVKEVSGEDCLRFQPKPDTHRKGDDTGT